LVDGDRPESERILDEGMRPDHSGVIVTAPGGLCPEVLFGFPVLVLHETRPGAVDSYWGQKLVGRLQSRAILVTTGGRYRVYAPNVEAAGRMALYLDSLFDEPESVVE
jgi:hypothetical protein